MGEDAGRVGKACLPSVSGCSGANARREKRGFALDHCVASLPAGRGFRWAKHEAAVRGDRVRLTAACSQPGDYASGQNSGSEYDSHCLEGFLLDGVPGVIDCVFGGVAPLFHGFHR
jgi:hypothetical protein